MTPSESSIFRASSLLLVLFHVITAVNAIPASATTTDDNPITLPVAKRFNFTGSTKILQHDQARARHLLTQGAARLGTGTLLSPSPAGSDIPAENQLVQYVASVRIGTPSTTYELVVDTGSSNTWVGAGQTYIQTSTTQQTRDQVSLTYGSGEYMSGVEFTDIINMGVAGLGLTVSTVSSGPTGLTIGTLNPDTTTSIPTVTDNLFSQSYIEDDIVSIYFQPTQANNVVNGVLSFGDTYIWGIVGAINYAPITSTKPSSTYWGINQGLRTRTPLIESPPTDVLNTYIGLVGAEFDETTNFFRITPAQYNSLQSLFFTINNVIYEFTANAQIWPQHVPTDTRRFCFRTFAQRNLNSAIGGTSDYVYLILGDIGWNSGTGMDFINGMTFIERYYMVFDTGNHRVGIANTPNTRATTN
ncbi:hypothetical protein ONZ51_g9666 [Trametes cubensis]|uniref:Peptidase A1 domain-containing protein n=1 Tax=Trametes cubensis TaxID=1111947 RepID=A0AAD7TNG7_9APHY|nr:hypothetical protein ONZ51_g9666 [Trametes cubensis]